MTTNNPFNLTVPNWTLLEAALVAASLPAATIFEWMWMAEYVAGEHSYKHRDTRSYARLSLNIGRTESARRVITARGPQPPVCAHCGTGGAMVAYLAARGNVRESPWCCKTVTL